eukprot:CAMPEP_0170541590 /NCGR_PEP_ID=MMETSP0211-20121228/1288_1 /TAXON_ID=311385 /ORGANISM="Pseudokeronopsis sp., Strain OXSARD2" /LENGTH=52 /DNA_ID=CAMNT_0010844379 /DNA_START=561 /DNA_END=716 /DNA_ORIENTATION=+
MDAKKFEKTSKVFEAEVQKRNFWLGSPKCIIIFGGSGALVALIIAADGALHR